jgi:hypothetical protein
MGNCFSLVNLSNDKSEPIIDEKEKLKEEYLKTLALDSK